MTDARLRAVTAHPLHRQLGLGHVEAADGGAVFEITVGPSCLNPAGVLHGGVLYLLCDVCAYAGLLSAIDADTEAVTHDIHVSVMQPVPAGQTARFVSRLSRLGKRIAFVDVDVWVERRCVASARVTKSLIPA